MPWWLARATPGEGHLAAYAIIFSAGAILLWRLGSWGLLFGILGISFHEGLWNMAYLIAAFASKLPLIIWAWAVIGALASVVIFRLDARRSIILLPWLSYLITWLAIGFPITLDYRYFPFGGKTPYYYSPFVNIMEIGSWALFCPLFLLYCELIARFTLLPGHKAGQRHSATCGAR